MNWNTKIWKIQPDVFKYKPISILVFCDRNHVTIISLHYNRRLEEFCHNFTAGINPKRVFLFFNVLLKIAWYCPFNIVVLSWATYLISIGNNINRCASLLRHEQLTFACFAVNNRKGQQVATGNGVSCLWWQHYFHFKTWWPNLTHPLLNW